MRHTDTPRRSRRILRSLVGTATASASPAAAAEPWLKPVLGGLLDRHNPPPSGFRVAEVAWAALQPAPGAALTANNPIDKDLAVAKAQGLKVKLRVLAGTSAPDWAKRLDGPPIPVVDEYGNRGSIGRFWTARVAGAYQDCSASSSRAGRALCDRGDTARPSGAACRGRTLHFPNQLTSFTGVGRCGDGGGRGA